MVIKMKIEELRSRITPLTKKEQYYKSHPNHSGDYLEKLFKKDDEKLIQMKIDRYTATKEKHAVFYDGQTLQMKSFPFLFIVQNKQDIHLFHYIQEAM